MASHIVTSYGPQATQANEEPPPESSLDLTLTQHPHDEEPEIREVCTHLEVEPPWACYYCIFPNSRTLVILLQVDLAFGDKFKIVYEGCYETKDTSIVAWFLVLGIRHYHWLCGFQFLALDTIVGYMVRFIDYFQITRQTT
jgi:hypothetical protein